MASLREQVREELLEYWKGGFDKYKYSDDYKYYVNDINKNLIGGNMDDAHRKMFENGSGSELKDTPAKAKAIDSSSMLAYNFFRNINDKCTITIDHVEYNKVFFEVKLQTLKGSSTPANLDVVLVSKDKQTVLFIESKFLEYLENGAAEFSDSYTKEDSYFIDNKVDVKDLLKMSNIFENNRGHYNYGIKQNICHLIGISNLKNSPTAQKWFSNTYKKGEYKDVYTDYDIKVFLGAKTYRFMNVLFCPTDEDAKKAYDRYETDLRKFYDKLPANFKKTYIHEESFIMNYREIFDLLSDKLQDEIRKELMNRYINFHSVKK